MWNFILSEELTNGIGNGLFAPEKNISRQDLAVIAYRLYVNRSKGAEINGEAKITSPYIFVSSNHAKPGFIISGLRRRHKSHRDHFFYNQRLLKRS